MKLTEEQHKLIQRNKIIMDELKYMECLYFDTLVNELGLDGVNFDKREAQDWLFDYLMNEDEDVSFKEYLEKYKIDL